MLVEYAMQAPITWAAAASLAITDTNPHYSDWLDAGSIGQLIAAVVNTHNQQITVTLQGSISKVATEIKDLPSPVVLAIGSVTATFDAMTLTDPWPFIRLKVVAAVAPASGVISANTAFLRKAIR